MKFKINRLQENDNIRTAAVITGFEQTMEEDVNNIESMFLDYRHYYAEEGGYSWPLGATDEDGAEYFQEGNEDLNFNN